MKRVYLISIFFVAYSVYGQKVLPLTKLSSISTMMNLDSVKKILLKFEFKLIDEDETILDGSKYSMYEFNRFNSSISDNETITIAKCKDVRVTPYFRVTYNCHNPTVFENYKKSLLLIKGVEKTNKNVYSDCSHDEYTRGFYAYDFIRCNVTEELKSYIFLIKYNN